MRFDAFFGCFYWKYLIQWVYVRNVDIWLIDWVEANWVYHLDLGSYLCSDGFSCGGNETQESSANKWLHVARIWPDIGLACCATKCYSCLSSHPQSCRGYTHYLHTVDVPQILHHLGWLKPYQQLAIPLSTGAGFCPIHSDWPLVSLVSAGMAGCMAWRTARSGLQSCSGCRWDLEIFPPKTWMMTGGTPMTSWKARWCPEFPLLDE